MIVIRLGRLKFFARFESESYMMLRRLYQMIGWYQMVAAGVTVSRCSSVTFKFPLSDGAETIINDDGQESAPDL
jgi:hypothetical protein